MMDVFHMMDSSEYNQVFYTKGSTDWHIWQKPNNCKMVSILCIGGGGGGGGGQVGTGSTTRTGGAGGGGAGYSLGIFTASNLPATLYLSIGPGGMGGTNGGAGSSGTLSYVSMEPNTTAINILLQSGNAAAGGGGGGVSGTFVGQAGTVWTGGIISDLGFESVSAGQAGTAGTSSVLPTAVTISNIITGGAGGGGYTTASSWSAGGSITGSGFVPTISGGFGANNGFGGNGSSGYKSLITNVNTQTRQPLFFTGGAGGGCSNNLGGGQGGNASFGSGGGGGGAGTTASNFSGRGGDGGDGLIIITCY